MSYEQVGNLVDKWLNDQVFRANFRKDPEGTLQKSGVKLSSEELVALRRVDWNQSDEELKSKVSKAFG